MKEVYLIGKKQMCTNPGYFAALFKLNSFTEVLTLALGSSYSACGASYKCVFSQTQLLENTNIMFAIQDLCNMKPQITLHRRPFQ